MGAVAAGNVVSYAKETEKVKPASETVAVDGYVSEPAREIPVVAKCDVLVAGGGPAGFAASLSAARQGANVIVLEKGGFLGGLANGTPRGDACPQRAARPHGEGNGSGQVISAIVIK